MNAARTFRRSTAVLLSALMAAVVSGCIVASVNPWLEQGSAMLTPSLAGVWVDTGEQQATRASFVTVSSLRGYKLMLTNLTDKTLWRYQCTLHAAGDTLLLQVGPDDKDPVSPGAMLPVFMLFKVELSGTRMKLYPVDTKGFAKRAEAGGLSLAEPPGRTNNEERVVITSMTETIEKFIASNVCEKTFFSAKPLYSFIKLESNVTAAAESPK